MTQKRKRPKSLYQRIKENTKIQTSATVILPVLLGVVIVVLWQTQTLHHLFRTDTFTLPLLDRIGSILFDNIDKIWENVVATMVVALAGLGLGSLLGYGIAMLIDILSGVMSGAAYLNKVGKFYSEDCTAMNVGFCFAAIDPKVVIGENYPEIINDFVSRLRNSEPIEKNMIRLPGDGKIKAKLSHSE